MAASKSSAICANSARGFSSREVNEISMWSPSVSGGGGGAGCGGGGSGGATSTTGSPELQPVAARNKSTKHQRHCRLMRQPPRVHYLLDWGRRLSPPGATP